MDKLILVFYLGCNNSNPEYFAEYSAVLERNIKSSVISNDVLYFILTDYDMTEGSVRLECINPKFLDKDQFPSITEKLIELENKLSKEKMNVNKETAE